MSLVIIVCCQGTNPRPKKDESGKEWFDYASSGEPEQL